MSIPNAFSVQYLRAQRDSMPADQWKAWESLGKAAERARRKEEEARTLADAARREAQEAAAASGVQYAAAATQQATSSGHPADTAIVHSASPTQMATALRPITTDLEVSPSAAASAAPGVSAPSSSPSNPSLTAPLHADDIMCGGLQFLAGENIARAAREGSHGAGIGADRWLPVFASASKRALRVWQDYAAYTAACRDKTASILPLLTIDLTSVSVVMGLGMPHAPGVYVPKPPTAQCFRLVQRPTSSGGIVAPVDEDVVGRFACETWPVLSKWFSCLSQWVHHQAKPDGTIKRGVSLLRSPPYKAPSFALGSGTGASEHEEANVDSAAVVSPAPATAPAVPAAAPPVPDAATTAAAPAITVGAAAGLPPRGRSKSVTRGRGVAMIEEAALEPVPVQVVAAPVPAPAAPMSTNVTAAQPLSSTFPSAWPMSAPLTAHPTVPASDVPTLPPAPAPAAVFAQRLSLEQAVGKLSDVDHGVISGVNTSITSAAESATSRYPTAPPVNPPTAPSDDTSRPPQHPHVVSHTSAPAAAPRRQSRVLADTASSRARSAARRWEEEEKTRAMKQQHDEEWRYAEALTGGSKRATSQRRGSASATLQSKAHSTSPRIPGPSFGPPYQPPTAAPVAHAHVHIGASRPAHNEWNESLSSSRPSLVDRSRAEAMAGSAQRTRLPGEPYRESRSDTFHRAQGIPAPSSSITSFVYHTGYERPGWREAALGASAVPVNIDQNTSSAQSNAASEFTAEPLSVVVPRLAASPRRGTMPTPGRSSNNGSPQRAASVFNSIDTRALSPGVRRRVMWPGQTWPEAEAALLGASTVSAGMGRQLAEEATRTQGSQHETTHREHEQPLTPPSPVAAMLLEHISTIESKLHRAEADKQSLLERLAASAVEPPRPVRSRAVATESASVHYDKRSADTSAVVESVLFTPADLSHRLSTLSQVARAVKASLDNGSGSFSSNSSNGYAPVASSSEATSVAASIPSAVHHNAAIGAAVADLPQHFVLRGGMNAGAAAPAPAAWYNPAPPSTRPTLGSAPALSTSVLNTSRVGNASVSGHSVVDTSVAVGDGGAAAAAALSSSIFIPVTAAVQDLVSAIATLSHKHDSTDALLHAGQETAARHVVAAPVPVPSKIATPLAAAIKPAELPAPPMSTGWSSRAAVEPSTAAPSLSSSPALGVSGTTAAYAVLTRDIGQGAPASAATSRSVLLSYTAAPDRLAAFAEAAEEATDSNGAASWLLKYDRVLPAPASPTRVWATIAPAHLPASARGSFASHTLIVPFLMPAVTQAVSIALATEGGLFPSLLSALFTAGALPSSLEATVHAVAASASPVPSPSFAAPPHAVPSVCLLDLLRPPTKKPAAKPPHLVDTNGVVRMSGAVAVRLQSASDCARMCAVVAGRAVEALQSGSSAGSTAVVLSADISAGGVHATRVTLSLIPAGTLASTFVDMRDGDSAGYGYVPPLLRSEFASPLNAAAPTGRRSSLERLVSGSATGATTASVVTVL